VVGVLGYRTEMNCFLWGTNWIYVCYVEESRPPLPDPLGWWSLSWDSKIRPWVLRDFDLRVTALARPSRNCTESQMRQQNKAVSPVGLRPKSDCSGNAQKQLYSNLQTRPLVREGATQVQTCNCLNKISRRKQTLVTSPRFGWTPRHTDWLTVGRNVTLTWPD
jgi:hypothetical protein